MSVLVNCIVLTLESIGVFQIFCEINRKVKEYSDLNRHPWKVRQDVSLRILHQL